MKHSTILRKSFILFLLIAVFAVGNLYAADDPLMNLLPNNCLFCVRINDFNSSLSKMDMYIAGTSPLPLSIAMQANIMLIGITGDSMLYGIDQGGDFALFAMLNPDKTTAIPVIGGALIPVKSYTDFVNNNPNCKSGENGTTILSAPNSPIGNVLLTEVANGQYALAIMESQKMTLGALKSAMSVVSKPLSAKLNASQSQNAATAPAWAYINLGLLYDTYQPMIINTFQQAQAQIPATGEETTAMVTFGMKLFTETFKTFGGDADSITIALTPEPALLSIDTTLRAKDGSELAGMLVANPNASKGFTMAGYMDNTNAVNGLMKMNIVSLQKIYDKIFDIMASTTEDSSIKEVTEKMKAMMKKSFAATGDEVAFSFSYAGGQPPFKMREVVAVRDSAAMKDLMVENIESANLIYQMMGLPAALKYQAGVSTYKGVPIDMAKIEIKTADDPNDPMQAAIEQMYGDSFAYYMAQTSDRFLMAMGANAEEVLKSMIDGPASAAPAGDIKVAIDTLQNTPYTDFVCSINIIKLLKGMGEMMQTLPQMQEIPAVGSIFASLKDIASQSSMVAGGSVADGQIALRTALPKQHLMEIITAVMKMQQQATETQQSQKTSVQLQTVPAPALVP